MGAGNEVADVGTAWTETGLIIGDVRNGNWLGQTGWPQKGAHWFGIANCAIGPRDAREDVGRPRSPSLESICAEDCCNVSYR